MLWLRLALYADASELRAPVVTNPAFDDTDYAAINDGEQDDEYLDMGFDADEAEYLDTQPIAGAGVMSNPAYQASIAASGHVQNPAYNTIAHTTAGLEPVPAPVYNSLHEFHGSDLAEPSLYQELAEPSLYQDMAPSTVQMTDVDNLMSSLEGGLENDFYQVLPGEESGISPSHKPVVAKEGHSRRRWLVASMLLLLLLVRA